ncbi:hypothetical protein [Companilactobacillus nantensis]|uniref:Uncharacterized protein n=1 Tax=Companilactobacillus nantensis DSM 16982 TaxID=1423774 RepID=A0A0R1WAI9_9LACO|nr:hypothetical protein [Companilactobacillus nantensis]KRM14655.1 hypothetical protein FD31_GL001718 [Companilactobacillus nantensis DSM 16982]GEO63440.1 hypothetical protein LNA01_06230 [Companilactobacillus nantensis]
MITEHIQEYTLGQDGPTLDITITGNSEIDYSHDDLKIAAAIKLIESCDSLNFTLLAGEHELYKDLSDRLYVAVEDFVPGSYMN